MEQGHVRRTFEAVERDLAESGSGMKVLGIVSGRDCYPPGEDALRLADDCRALGIDVLSAEDGDRRLLVAGQVYSDVYAVVLLPPGLPAVAAARHLQRLLAADSLLRPEERLLPASEVLSLLGRWEWQVAVIFGPAFAAKAVEKACAGHDCGRMTSRGIGEVRRCLVSATGGSIDFTEST
ncbi:hypothetical protein [Methanocella arvoryzae]|nr:hypothetical protein [Methanocella arvoryzae]